LNALALANAFENVPDASRRSYGNRFASIELRVVPIELGQPQKLFGELLQRSLRTRHGEFERTRNVHARIRLEKLDTSSQVQDSSAGLKVEKSSSERRVWDLLFTSIEREDERTLHGWIADLLPRTELEVMAERGDRT